MLAKFPSQLDHSSADLEAFSAHVYRQKLACPDEAYACGSHPTIRRLVTPLFDDFFFYACTLFLCVLAQFQPDGEGFSFK